MCTEQHLLIQLKRTDELYKRAIEVSLKKERRIDILLNEQMLWRRSTLVSASFLFFIQVCIFDILFHWY